MKNRIKDGYVRRMDHVVWKVIDGKGVLLNLEDGSYFDVDPVGLGIWELCNGRATLNEIMASTSQRFPANSERVSKDVPNFVKDLKAHGLVEVTSAPAPALTRS